MGASGEVYLADDTQLRRQVAVKVLHRVLAGDEVFLERFRSEARMAAGLNHPNVVAVHDWGEDEVPFLVTEYLGGGSLRAMLDQNGPLTPSQTLLIALEATRGLEYAHKRGVVQRDIKRATCCSTARATFASPTSGWRRRWPRPRPPSRGARCWGPSGTPRPNRRRASD